jgi:hypothetical protein
LACDLLPLYSRKKPTRGRRPLIEMARRAENRRKTAIGALQKAGSITMNDSIRRAGDSQAENSNSVTVQRKGFRIPRVAVSFRELFDPEHP